MISYTGHVTSQDAVNHVEAFLNNMISTGKIELDPHRNISFSSLYQLYLDWIENTGHATLNRNRFIRSIHILGGVSLKGSRGERFIGGIARTRY